MFKTSNKHELIKDIYYGMGYPQALQKLLMKFDVDIAILSGIKILKSKINTSYITELEYYSLWTKKIDNNIYTYIDGKGIKLTANIGILKI